jgi:hypothetical protein
MRRFSFPHALVLALALTGCPGGSEEAAPPPEPAPETTPEPTPEAVAATDDDDSAGAPQGADVAPEGGADAEAASADAGTTEEAAAEAEVGSEDPGTPQAGKPDDPPPPPPPGSLDPPFDIALNTLSRTSNTEGEVQLSVRGSAPIANAIKWTTSTPMTGPTKKSGAEDSTYTWTIKGLPMGEAKGTITGAYETWAIKVDYAFAPVDVPPAPPAAPPTE